METQQPTPKSVAWRKNVLALFGMGYLTVLLIFGGLIFTGGASALEAYEAVKTLLTGLTSGALAISKDLI